MRSSAFFLLPLLLHSAIASADEPPTGLVALLAQPDELVFESAFEGDAPLRKTEWTPRQGTQWKPEAGVLRGRPSPPEYQAEKKDHKGLEPRISAPVTPPEFIAQLSFRFAEGAENRVVPFIEFGHHILRVRFSAEEGIELLADHESVRVARAPDFKWESGKWYHALAEMKGEEFVIQFKDGPTLYAKHPAFAKPAPSGGSGFGMAGPRGGIAELDDVSLWSIKTEPQEGWEKCRESFPKFELVQVREKPTK